MAEKNKGGAKKFFLGALIGGVVGTIAGKFYKTNEKEIKEEFDKKISELSDKFNDSKTGAKDKKAGAKKVKKTAKNA